MIESRELENMLDDAPVMVWLSDSAGACVFLNRHWFDFTGLSKEDSMGDGWLDAIHPDDRSRLVEALKGATADREPYRVECRLRSKDGRFRWALNSAAPRFEPEGDFIGFIGTVTDIHRQKDVEERLRASEERYRHLFNSIDEGLCVMELIFDEKDRPIDYRWLEINPSFGELTGLSDAVGKTARELVPDLEESWFETYGRVALTGEPIRFENHVPAMNRWFDVFAFRVDHPNRRRVALLFNEISERKTREMNAAFLAEVGNVFATASHPDEIMTVVAEKLCRHLQVNSAAFGEVDDAGEFVTVAHQRQEEGFPSVSGIHRLADFMTDSFLSELRAGRTVAVSDVASDPRTAGMAQAYTKFGVKSQIQAPHLSEGRWKFMLAVYSSQPREWRRSEIDLMHDLSARVWLSLDRARAEEGLRESERSLRKLSRSLEQRVNERTVELQEQAARLRKMASDLASAEQRERKRLAALLHDDLQQLLVAASMHLGNAGRRMKDAADRQAVEQAARWIGEATTAARALTHQLRPPALYEDGLVAALHGLAAEMEERHHLKVIIVGGDAGARLSDDIKALLFESIRELLFNAAKHAETREAHVRVNENGRWLRVEVEDEGAGFDVREAARNRSGTSFGLFSIRERLVALGGHITIESELGKGTRIGLEVPLLPEILKPRSPALSGGATDKGDGNNSHVSRASGQTIRVLVADDHAMVRQGLATLLSEDERVAVVAEAADGCAAVEAVEEHRPDVILVDVNMPRMNGIEATREINQRWPDVVVIGLSVQDDATTAKAMIDAGAAAFLSKGGGADRMIATIVDLSNQARERSGRAGANST